MKQQPKINEKKTNFQAGDIVFLSREVTYPMTPSNLGVRTRKRLVLKRGTGARIRHVDTADQAYVNFLGHDGLFPIPAEMLSRTRART